jgi:hypothetical protein
MQYPGPSGPFPVPKKVCTVTVLYVRRGFLYVKRVFPNDMFYMYRWCYVNIFLLLYHLPFIKNAMAKQVVLELAKQVVCPVLLSHGRGMSPRQNFLVNIRARVRC